MSHLFQAGAPLVFHRSLDAVDHDVRVQGMVLHGRMYLIQHGQEIGTKKYLGYAYLHMATDTIEGHNTHALGQTGVDELTMLESAIRSLETPCSLGQMRPHPILIESK